MTLQVDSDNTIKKVMDAKRKEIEAGVAGFMVYDVRLVPAIKKVDRYLCHLRFSTHITLEFSRFLKLLKRHTDINY